MPRRSRKKTADQHLAVDVALLCHSVSVGDEEESKKFCKGERTLPSEVKLGNKVTLAVVLAMKEYRLNPATDNYERVLRAYGVSDDGH